MENQANNKQPSQSNVPQHNRFEFSEVRQPLIFFNSRFDSGNMHKVIKNSADHYSIWTACDAQGTDNQGYPKSWFYFEVGGFINRKVAFSIHRVHFLSALSKKSHLYRPVYRITYHDQPRSQWLRLPHPVLSLGITNEGITLKFDYLFTDEVKSIEFAFIYPYSYESCREDVLNLKEKYENDKDLFFHHFQLAKSYEGRAIDCIVISSHEGKEGFQTIKGAPFQNKKITKFRNNKPIIFISARVHPIETPSSYCMNGIITFLLDKKDMRAHLLRKYFVFVLVPMLNPDGVSRGHCRMDILNQNLNRYYTDPDSEIQPSCFAVKKLCQHYTQDKRLFMYLDLHAHPALKGNFTFGNAIYEFIEQVESQIFPKMLSENCINFEFQQCIFSRKHMKAKDRNEQQTKQGCGRVVLYKQFGIVHSYTLECGYHMNTFNNELQAQKNTSTRFLVRYRLNEKGEKIYEINQKALNEQRYNRMIQAKDKPKYSDVFEFTSNYLDDKDHDYYKREIPTYSIDTFHNLGRNIVITILDIWNKNPYSRLDDLNVHRKEIAERQAKLDRFRKEQAGIKTKQKRIVELIEEQFYGDWHKRNVFNPASYSQQREKKRNNTLQAQKMNVNRATKSQKSEKTVKIEPNQQKRDKNTDTIETDMLEAPNPSTTLKLSLNDQESQKAVQSRAGSKNFKLSRINFTSSLTHNNDKQSNRLIGGLNRQIVGTTLKIGMENEFPRNTNDVLSVHSKAMKIPNFNACNLRVRNMVAAVRASEDTNIRPKATVS